MKKTLLGLTCILFLSINLIAENKTTPLIQAVLSNNTNQVETLLKGGADRHAKDTKGLSALDYAISNNLPYIAQITYTNNPNKFIFLRPKQKPLYITFNKNGFNLANKNMDKKAIVLGTIIPDSYKEVCESYDRALKNNITLSTANLQMIFSLNDKESYKKAKEIKKDCQNITIFTYPNYKFYKFLSNLFGYRGAPQLLFRKKDGKLVGGTIETYFFEKSKNFKKIFSN